MCNISMKMAKACKSLYHTETQVWKLNEITTWCLELWRHCDNDREYDMTLFREKWWQYNLCKDV